MKKISLAILAFSGLFAASAAFAAPITPTVTGTDQQEITTSSADTQISPPSQYAWMMGRQTDPGMMRGYNLRSSNQNESDEANTERGYRPYGFMLGGCIVAGITLLLVWSLLISAIMALCQWTKKMKAQK